MLAGSLMTLYKDGLLEANKTYGKTDKTFAELDQRDGVTPVFSNLFMETYARYSGFRR